jgi:hypothetical protein
MNGFLGYWEAASGVYPGCGLHGHRMRNRRLRWSGCACRLWGGYSMRRSNSATRVTGIRSATRDFSQFLWCRLIATLAIRLVLSLRMMPVIVVKQIIDPGLLYAGGHIFGIDGPNGKTYPTICCESRRTKAKPGTLFGKPTR